MISVKYIVVLLFFLNVQLKTLANVCNIRTEKKRFFQSPRNSLINFIAKKKGYDTSGWIDISHLEGNFDRINIKIHNDKVICNGDNQIFEVSVKKQKLIKQTESATYNEVSFNYHHLGPNSCFLDPVPVMKSNSYSNAADSKQILPSNFEGYIVCEKKDSNALLIPKNFETVEFIAPPWSVRVSIDVYKNPISKFGRQFRVTIMDNVSILMNNQSSFNWPVPFESFYEVYDFHLAVKDSREGRFCVLERSVETFELSLSCHSWRRTYKLGLTNSFLLAGFIGMNAIQGISYPFSKVEKIKYYESELKENENAKILLQDGSKKPDDADVHVHESYEKNKKSKKWIGAVSNIVYLGLTALINLIYGTVKFVNISLNLDRFNREFEEAPVFYLWKLQYPEGYYTPVKPKFYPDDYITIDKGDYYEVTDKETREVKRVYKKEKDDKAPKTEETSDTEKKKEVETEQESKPEPESEPENYEDPSVMQQVEAFVADNSSS